MPNMYTNIYNIYQINADTEMIKKCWTNIYKIEFDKHGREVPVKCTSHKAPAYKIVKTTSNEKRKWNSVYSKQTNKPNKPNKTKKK